MQTQAKCPRATLFTLVQRNIFLVKQGVLILIKAPVIFVAVSVLFMSVATDNKVLANIFNVISTV